MTTKPHSNKEVERDEKWSDELQHAYDSILFNHNPIEVDKPFASMLEKVLTQLLHQELQKARHDWLREEIVRLEAEQRNHHCSRYDGNDYDNGAYVALQTIIDRYHSELDQPINSIFKE